MSNFVNPHNNSTSALDYAKREIYSYHLTVFSDKDELYELWLPKTIEGFFQFDEAANCNFINIVAKNGAWYAVCRKPAFFKEVPMANSYEIAISDGDLLKIDIDDKEFLLLAEKVSPQRNIFRNYNLCSNVEITIGSQPDCDIYYNGPYVSRKHATISRTNGQWCVKNYNSLYGIFVNGKKQSAKCLNLGDVVFIMGLKIIIGPKFLSMNNGLSEVKVNPQVIETDTGSRTGHYRYYNDDSTTETENFFNRSPRKRWEIEKKVITVEGPPLSMSQQQMPLMLRMGSSMVMGGAAALAGNFMTLITSVLFPFLSSKYTDKQRTDYENLRKTKYTEYLQKKEKEIIDAINYEQAALNNRYPNINNATEQDQLIRHLWERRPCDSDFLQLRVGTGKRPLMAQIDYPLKGFELESDYLENQMYQLVEKKYVVDNVPIVLSLADTYICGVQGQRKRVIEFIKSLLLQIAVFHSYDEVKMVFLTDKNDLKQLDFVRYLSHAWDDMRTIRFLATNEAEAFSVGEYLKNQIAEEKATNDTLQQILKKRPYYVIFALNKKTFEGHELFKDILKNDYNQGVSIITAFDSLVKESQKIITLQDANKNLSTTMGIDGGDDEIFSEDYLSPTRLNQTLHTISNILLKKITQTQAMPKTVTFMEMFSAGRIEQLNPLKRWQDNDPVRSLATPIGVGEDGTLFALDLHEKRQGPHGLVAGMTGSGKSEFLITYILSMAINYHPNEVSFVLIDYKGGGLASAFDNPKTGIRLPHLVGTITNLDGSSISRSLSSIESELIRRQRVFNKVSNALNEGTMNIYTYQKLYRAGKVSEPMPHLFIISDEFAELKQQQPEFMEKLISAARIGRSLGVHLILATQKPGGVVNDQIRSNTKFQVCLRVQERSDSMDMLKRPDAAELTDTGRFYLQVGYNEYFALGQSAWCGAPYEPSDSVVVKRDDSIEFLDNVGQVRTKTRLPVRKTSSGMNQTVAIVEYLDSLAKSQKIQCKALWQPELPVLLDLDALQNENKSLDNPMSVCLGKLDDPQNQNQFPMKIDFKTCGNILVAGDAGSGKTTIIQNIIYSLSNQLSPHDFNFYLLDYSSRLLKQFNLLPHCGAILQEEDAPALDEFFKIINQIVSQRKKLFSELEVNDFREARKKQSIPLIMVFIDNFAGLSTSRMGESHAYQFQRYLKDSALYGVKYVVSVSNVREIPSKIRQEFEEGICLRLRDKYDYTDVIGCKVVNCPAEIPGRALCNIEGRPLELQVARLCADYEGTERIERIKGKIDSICKQNSGQYVVQHMPVFDEDAEYELFAAQFGLGRIPLGYAKDSGKPIALPLKQFSTLALYFGNENGTKSILNNLLYAFQRENIELWIIKRKEKSLFDAENTDGISVKNLKNADFLDCNADNLNLLQQALVGVIKSRKPEVRIETQNSGDEENVTIGKIMLLIESIEDFVSELNPLGLLSYQTLFDKTAQNDIYVVGCFEPQDADQAAKNGLVSVFEDNEIILFGGQYDKQTLYNFGSISGVSDLQQFNVALMQYRKQIHPILMPCGKISKIKEDEDLESIF